MLHTPEIAANMYKLFDDINIGYDQCDEGRWKQRGTSIDPKLVNGGCILNIHEDTIKENVELLELFINEIQQFNKNIKILFTLLPKSIAIESIRDLLPQWSRVKEGFYNIVNNLCMKYSVVFWDYQKRVEISENPTFFADDEHLNTVGARAFTAILNEDLKRL